MEDIKKIKIEDKGYPELLRDIKNPPKQLYIMGNEKILNDRGIAIIGSRMATDIGLTRAKQWANKLSEYGFCINSGLAKGIDSSAHIGALEVSGKTIAVMGTGFGTIFPKENEKLFEDIIKHGGTVLTEYENNIGVKSNRFIARNRIVSGLSEGIVVIESKYRSGTSITANFAKEQGRKVFCLPHDINDKSGIGTNELIRKGAKLVMCVEDILKEFGNVNIEKSEKTIRNKQVPKEYEIIYKMFSNEPLHINEICRKSNLQIGTVNYILTMLELEGYIKQLAGKQFILGE